MVRDDAVPTAEVFAPDYELFRDVHIRQSRPSNLSSYQVVPDPAQLVREKLHTLKKGGLFVTTDPCCWEITAPIEKWLCDQETPPLTEEMLPKLRQALEIPAEADKVPWGLRNHDCKFLVHLNYCLVGRKREVAQEGTDGT